MIYINIKWQAIYTPGTVRNAFGETGVKAL